MLSLQSHIKDSDRAKHKWTSEGNTKVTVKGNKKNVYLGICSIVGAILLFLCGLKDLNLLGKCSNNFKAFSSDPIQHFHA